MKKGAGFYLLICLIGIILASGCETAKGAAVGVASTAEGVVKDTQHACNVIWAMDGWIKKNLW